MRIAVMATAMSLTVVGLSSAADVEASIKRPTQIAAQGLAPALRAFARERGFQIVFASSEVAAVRTAGASGELTVDEALIEMLAGTGLSYRYLDEKTVAVYSQAAEQAAGAGGSRPASGKPTASVDPSTGLRLSQYDAARNPSAAAGSAAAQPGASAESKVDVPQDLAEALPEVLVRGAKSMNTDLSRGVNDAQPYYILDDKMIEQSGAINMEDLLKRNLSMSTTARSGVQSAHDTSGNTSAVNLRGLGTNQTLILINGRRTANLSNGRGATTQADLNTIPLGMIDHIEVLPSSASAIYGGAAGGGAVNVVLKHDYHGGRIDATYDNTTRSDGRVRTVDVSYGISPEEGRTNIMIGAHYSDAQALLLEDRPNLTMKGISTVLRNNPTLLQGPSSPFGMATTPNIASRNGSPLTLRDGTSLGSSFTHVPAGFSETSDLAGLVGNAGSYNNELAPVVGFTNGLLGNLITAPTIKSVLFNARRDMTDRFQLFTEFFYSSNVARSYEGDFTGNFSVAVPASSPANPFLQDVNVTYPNATVFPFSSKSESRRWVIGGIVTLPRDWRAEADHTWNRATFSYAGGGFDFARVNSSLASGTLNPFVDVLAHPETMSALDDLHGTFGIESAPSTLKDSTLRIAGPIGRLPAGRPLLVIGIGYRKEGIGESDQYTRFPNNPLSSNDRLYLAQSQTTQSLYGESKIPLVAPTNGISGVNLLDLQLSVRMEKYSVDTGTAFVFLPDAAHNEANNSPLVHYSIDYTSTNPTIGLRYKPVESLMFRASYGTAFLPPAYSQLLPGIPPIGVGAFPVLDPRRGNSIVNVSLLSGGNPDLKPTSTHNWDIGLVFEPSFLEGLRLNLEYWRLEQDDVIVTPTVQQIVNAESQYPGRVVRSAPSPGDPFGVGPISLVDYSLINGTKAETDGFDAGASYRWKTQAWGDFSLAAQATKIEHFKLQRQVNAPYVDVVNQIYDGGPLKLRASASLTWDLRDWSVGWMTNYFGSYLQFAGNGGAYIQAQGSDHVRSQTYHSLFGSYRFSDGAQRWHGALDGVSVQFGIRNLFDSRPPFDANANRIYYSPYGDPRLRSYWMSVSKDF